MPRKTLYLIDGSNLIFRAFFAIRSLSNAEGFPTNAVYGFTAMLLKLLKEEKPDYLAVVLDTSAKTFRNELYPDYKGHRPPVPEDLAPQFAVIREMVAAFNIVALRKDGFEADDIIATLAEQGLKKDVDTVIVSSDKDMMQLVNERIQMLDTMKNVRYRPTEVQEKMGVRPDQVVDLLALMGDTADNIPGVPGIGQKTAAQLLGEFENLDGIYAGIESLKGKKRERLEEHKEAAYLSQELATVMRDVELDKSVDDLAVKEPDRAALTELFARLDFKTWHREFHDPTGTEESANLSQEGYSLVTTPNELATLKKTLEEAPVFAFDTETTGLDTLTAELVGLSFAIDAEKAWYVPVGHTGDGSEAQLDRDLVLQDLGPLLEDPNRGKAAQNGKYDLQILKRAGVEVRGLIFDSMLANYLLAPNRYRHSLDHLALDWLNHKTISYSEVVEETGKENGFAGVPLERATVYACEDAQLVMALYERMESELEENGVQPLFEHIEMPLVPVLAKMQTSGVRVNNEMLQTLSHDMGKRAQTLEAQCHELAEEEFSLGSPKQLGKILFEKLQLPAKKRTKTGYSTNSAVLEELSNLHDLPGLILEWRSLTKLKSTYTDVLPKLVHPETGRIHASFNQAVAATGRLSSADPNLQNIPIRTEDGRKIREAFIPGDGNLFLAVDYSQIELRILAHLCGDAAMRQAFIDGADIHARTATMLFGVPQEAVSREQRNIAKTVNFGILYGMSAFRLAREQGISRPQAKEIIDLYFSRYPGILSWKEATLEEGRETGRVTTLMNRIRPLPDLNSRNGMSRKAAERVAINTPVQGSAADIMKKAMIHIDQRIQSDFPDLKMILQVHDELVFEVPEDKVEAARDMVIEEMEQVVELEVPLVANAGIGDNWLKAH